MQAGSIVLRHASCCTASGPVIERSCGVAGFAKSVLEGALALGRAASGVRGPLKAWRSRRLREIFARRRSLRLQFPKEDLGFCYASMAVAVQSADKGAPAGGPPGERAAPGAEVRHTPFVPSAAVGCRLPHCWLQVHAARGRASHLQPGSKLSSIDFPAQHGGCWVVFLPGQAAAGGPMHKPQLLTVAIVDSAWDCDSSALASVDCIAIDVNGAWAGTMRLDDHHGSSGSILVRPDGHVAWHWSCK